MNRSKGLRPGAGTRLRSDGGVSLLRLRRLADHFRQSLFFLPAIFVIASIVLGMASVRVDRSLEPGDLPSGLSTTVDNARSILSTIAGGTIGSASVVFSLTLIAVQLASSQYSPRVLRGYLGDRFQQVVMGIVVGTFTYSLVVLRVVQEPFDESASASPFLPRVSVMVAVLLAVASLLGVLASIDHTAKSLRVGSLLDNVANETIETVRRLYVRLDDDDSEHSLLLDAPGIVPAAPKRPRGVEWQGEGELAEFSPPDDALVVRSVRAGWVTQISVQGILNAIGEDSTVLLRTAVGTYLIPGAPIVSVWPVSSTEALELSEQLRDVVEVRDARTLQQDVSFGLLQLTDVAMRALSPAVNDPNTASEAVVRIGLVLSELLQCDLSTNVIRSGGQTVVRAGEVSAHDYVNSAIEPIRRYAKSEPMVLQVLLRTLASVIEAVEGCSNAQVDCSAITEQIDRIAHAVTELKSPEARDAVGQVVDEVTEQ